MSIIQTNEHGLPVVRKDTFPINQVKITYFGLDGRPLRAGQSPMADRFIVEAPGIDPAFVKGAQFDPLDYSNPGLLMITVESYVPLRQEPMVMRLVI
jgi:hypothetical protein